MGLVDAPGCSQLTLVGSLNRCLRPAGINWMLGKLRGNMGAILGDEMVGG